MAAEDVFRKVRAIRWDGSNGAEVAAVCDGIAVDQATWTVERESADEGILTLRQAQSEVTYALWPVHADHPWVVVGYDFGIIGRFTDDEYASLWTEADEVGTMVGVGRVADQLLENIPWLKKAAKKLRASLYGGFGVLSLPAIAPAATVVAEVGIRPAQPDDKYDVEAFIAGSVAAMNGNLVVVGIERVSGSRADVTIKNNGQSSVSGALVLVHVS